MSLKRSAVFVVVFLVPCLIAAACSATQPAPSPLPNLLLVSAPRACPFAIERGDAVPRDLIALRMQGRLPSWLPAGFGFVGSWTDKTGTWVTWTDDRCREVTVAYSPGQGASEPPNRPRVGLWTVSVDAPGACGNEVLGTATCLGYDAASSNAVVGMQAMGIERTEGDRIALSIPL